MGTMCCASTPRASWRLSEKFCALDLCQPDEGSWFEQGLGAVRRAPLETLLAATDRLAVFEA
jgi:hypothetical protein